MSVQGWILGTNIPAGGTGTVTSVGLAAPVSLFSVTGSPVTTAGTLTLSLQTQSANQVFIGPPSGPAAAPGFRALVAADIPDLSGTYATLAGANNFTNNNTFSSTGFLQIPVGTTVQQPGSPANGMIRLNSTTGRFEFYNGSWMNFVRLSGDTMTGDLTVPDLIANTTVKLLDTTAKTALDVPAANTLRVGNGFTALDFVSDVTFASATGIRDANGVYLISFPAAVSGATNYIQILNSNAAAPVIQSVGTNAPLTIQSVGVGLMKVGTGSGGTIGITPTAGFVTIGVGTAVIFKDTNAGGNLNSNVSVNNSVNATTAGVVTNGFNNNVVGGELAWYVGNGGARIATAGIRIAVTSSTAGSEASDLTFYTMTGGSARALRFTISSSASTFTTDVKLGTAGNGLYVKEGTNATMGTGTLSGGTATISTTKVTANSRIFLTDAGGGVLANIGSLYVSARSVGASFTVTSNNALDTSNFYWLIVEPA